MKKIVIASIAAGALAVSIAVPATAGLVEPVGLVYAPHDCTTPKIEPKRITLACGDANAYLGKMKWSDWGTEKAKGEGWYYENNCDPDCASGDFISYGVVLFDMDHDGDLDVLQTAAGVITGDPAQQFQTRLFENTQL